MASSRNSVPHATFIAPSAPRAVPAVAPVPAAPPPPTSPPASSPTSPPTSTSTSPPAPANKRRTAGGSPGGQQQPSWQQFARDVERLAGQLGALAVNLPPGEPEDKEAKSLRRSVGRLSEGLGKLKRAPKSGLPG